VKRSSSHFPPAPAPAPPATAAPTPRGRTLGVVTFGGHFKPPTAPSPSALRPPSSPAPFTSVPEARSPWAHLASFAGSIACTYRRRADRGAVNDNEEMSGIDTSERLTRRHRYRRFEPRRTDVDVPFSGENKAEGAPNMKFRSSRTEPRVPGRSFSRQVGVSIGTTIGRIGMPLPFPPARTAENDSAATSGGGGKRER